MKKDTKQSTKRNANVVKKRQIVNMNYPPADMPMKELERFWGEPTVEDREWAEELRNQVVKKKSEPSAVRYSKFS